VFGPHMENFAALAKALVSNTAAIQISDTETLESAVTELLRDIDARQRLVRNAQGVLREHQGATARAAALVHALEPRQ